MINKEYSWYLLSNAPGFGSKSIHYLYKNLKPNNLTITDLFKLEVTELQKLFPNIGRGKFSRASFESFQKLSADDKLLANFEKIKSEGVAIIGLDDSRYPKSVLKILGTDAPPLLYCKGHLPLLNQKSVSIIGARNIGEFEISFTKNLAQKLAENGLNVTSGYAKGVDTSAHLGALEANGTTTMILSFGTRYLNVKREIKKLNWEKNSLFLTQFAPSEKFSGKNAMTRNKLVCAISDAIIIIKSGPERDESGKMSGTYNAGKFALKMGIPVFVLSPKLFNVPPKGNSDLIKIGAKEFSNEKDIIKSVNEINNVISNEGCNINNKPINPYQTSLFD